MKVNYRSDESSEPKLRAGAAQVLMGKGVVVFCGGADCFQNLSGMTKSNASISTKAKVGEL